MHILHVCSLLALACSHSHVLRSVCMFTAKKTCIACVEIYSARCMREERKCLILQAHICNFVCYSYVHCLYSAVLFFFFKLVLLNIHLALTVYFDDLERLMALYSYDCWCCTLFFSIERFHVYQSHVRVKSIVIYVSKLPSEFTSRALNGIFSL